MSYYYYLICLSLLISCGGNKPKANETAELPSVTESKDEVKYVNSIKLESPEKNSLYSYNDEISIVIRKKERFDLDSAEIFLNSKKIATIGKEILNYSFKIPEDQGGEATLKVIAHHPDKKRGVAVLPIRIKPDKAPRKYGYDIVKVYPHDAKAYTQGLTYLDGFMYEGTGQYGESSLRKVSMPDNKILSTLNIDSKLFGEGITIYKDKIYQITWKSHKGFVYDLKTFTLESTFNYNSEGWGITTAGDKLIMSDGSNKLYHIEPASFNIMKEVQVYDHNGEVKDLNELEYIDGLIWANVWLTNRIVIIHPETGAVVGELDMSKLLPQADRNKLDDEDDVLNGIAYNPEKNTIFLTGKRWPKLFEIKLKGDF